MKFTIQSGATRRRDFYCPGELTGYFKLEPSDRVGVYIVDRDAPAPGDAGA
ncbi:MAG: hypothetical protein ACR2LE_07735 [Nocardioidaceae bacterium]